MIKNQVFLKRPWLFAVFTVIGASYIFLPVNNLGTMTRILVFVGTVVVLNAWFLLSLKRTRKKGQS